MTCRFGIGLLLLMLLSASSQVATSMEQTVRQDGAQALEPSGFERIDDAHSIYYGVVSALAEDARGFIWIGTPAGLVRYDGYRFRAYLSEPGNPHSLTGNHVRALLASRDGRLWVGTEIGGVSVYDPDLEHFRTFQNLPGDPDSLPAGSIRALAEDLEGGIWIGSTGGGLSRWDSSSDELELVSSASDWDAPVDRRIQSLLVDRAGDLWIGSWNGLLRIRRGHSLLERQPVVRDNVDPLAGEVVTRLFEDHHSALWVGTRSGSLLRIDATRERAETIADHDAPALRGPSEIHDIAQNHPDWIWIAREGGIELRSSSDGGLLQKLRHDPLRPDSLPSNQVRALMRDRAGRIWSGSYGGGVLRHSPTNSAMRMRRGEPGEDGIFAEPNVRSVAEMANGEIWVGTQERGVAIFDASWRLVGSVPITRETFGIETQHIISAIVQAADGTIWLAGDGVLYRRDPADGRVSQFAEIGVRIRRMLGTADGMLWIATGDGLYRLPPHSSQFHRMQLAEGGVLGGDVNAISEAADGSVWVGAATGLFRVEPGAPALRAVHGVNGHELAHQTVLGLLVDRAQTLWIDTPAGLHRLLDSRSQAIRFDRVSERLGIAGSPFGANLLEDAQGRVWSQQYVHDPRRDSVYQLGPVDGVDIGTPWYRSYAKTRAGELLFGGSRGLLIVDPERFEPTLYQPPMVLTELRVDGSRRALGDPARGLVLAPSERSFSIEFAALDFSAPQQLRYAYRLEGYSESWIETDAGARFASYSNLAPGHYLLHARGSNRSGEWSPHDLQIPITVLPQWWQTWWFRLLAILAAVAAIAGFVRLRTANLRQRRAELEAEVARRTAELLAMSEDLASKSRELEEASLTDPLTGLRNRRYLTQHIDADVALSMRQHEPPARAGWARPAEGDLVFFLIDIDHFKQVNDVHGHSAGDRVLVEMRHRLDQVFRRSDHLVRWGGEEFLVVNRAANRENAAELAERARLAVASAPFQLDDGVSIDKTCSVGFCSFPLWPDQPRAVAWTTAIDLADSALYAAKRAGRDGWVGFREGRAAPSKPAEVPAHFDLLPILCSDQLSMQSSSPREVVLAALTAHAAKELAG